MDEEEIKSLKLINDSGFPFQLRVEHEISSTSNTHQWKVVSKEHAWKDERSGDEGFIDLVLRHQNMILEMVIECKRRRGEAARWVFLVTDEQKQYKRNIRCLWADSIPNKKALHGWADFSIIPSSPESEFCAVAGQSDRDKPMLERMSEELLNAMECLAFEEMQLAQLQNPPESHRCIYIPAIVTTARLDVCRIDPADISLDDGTVPPDKGNIETVDFVRFRKSLSTELTSGFSPSNLEGANRDKERTILIIHAPKISRVLEGWDLKKLDSFDKTPWEIARAIE